MDSAEDDNSTAFNQIVSAYICLASEGGGMPFCVAAVKFTGVPNHE